LLIAGAFFALMFSQIGTEAVNQTFAVRLSRIW